jgi:hypothetical protein
MRDDSRTNPWVNLLALCVLTAWPVIGPIYLDNWDPDGGPRLVGAIIIFWSVGAIGSYFLLRTDRFRI